ncbi:hypothetical protein NQX30_05135 [Candidatus Persebacteraceae bacterium Df01]|uniref:DNA-directed DNA polymerase n=1 Tax=Candidatus Doriopsillibacter californiensis TaxID=2970740 RepID=A0ABT7QMW4_9GAMM|nr:hypothetical protein [Candidatus Persebacteraceae bacterium Df01]
MNTISFASATLITGHPGAGSESLALTLATVFADTTSEAADADIIVIRPEKNTITVDAVRQVVEFCALAPLVARRRVAVFIDSERMNIAAANALLKTLEEPSADKALILSVHSPSLLPPTVTSRCRILFAPLPTEAEAATWLQANGGDGESLSFSGGLPLAALNTDMQAVRTAKDLFSQGNDINTAAAVKTLVSIDLWLDCLQKWTADGVRAAMGLTARYFPGSESILSALCADPRRWLDGHARLLDQRRLAAHPLAQDLFIYNALNEYRLIFTH